jgi:hypothetical protein
MSELAEPKLALELGTSELAAPKNRCSERERQSAEHQIAARGGNVGAWSRKIAGRSSKIAVRSSNVGAWSFEIDVPSSSTEARGTLLGASSANGRGPSLELGDPETLGGHASPDDVPPGSHSAAPTVGDRGVLRPLTVPSAPSKLATRSMPQGARRPIRDKIEEVEVQDKTTATHMGSVSRVPGIGTQPTSDRHRSPCFCEDRRTLSTFPRGGGLSRRPVMRTVQNVTRCILMRAIQASAVAVRGWTEARVRDRRTMSVFKHGQRPSTHC